MNRKSQSQLKLSLLLIIPCIILICILLFVSASSTQYAYPNQDVSVGSWSDGGSAEVDEVLWNSMDEEAQDGDDSYATGTQNAGTFEVNLTDVDDPETNTGHIVHIYGKGVGGGGPEKVDTSLYEGGTLIATIVNNWAPGRDSYVDVAYTLDAGEADAIGDYSNLIVRVVEDSINGGEEFRVTQIYMEFPDVPSADTCTYVSGNWAVNCADYCNITSNVNVGSNNIILSGTGQFTILANITADSIAWTPTCQIINAPSDGKELRIKGG